MQQDSVKKKRSRAKRSSRSARDRRRRKRAKNRKAILARIPDVYADLYPAARELRRRFILHVGPTNSGKTHDALEALFMAPTGVYLGPIRLLAYEVHERLNKRGLPCDMITGEERILVPGAAHRASTIEMLDINREYDVAVIDEAQMCADVDRGGAWTRAILGVCADEVHVCMAPQALSIVVKLIADCGDTHEIVLHKRAVGISYDKNRPVFPEGILKGDALIAFSRRDVHGIAYDLARTGHKCSVIYGALPYDVRHEEARKFAAGESDVVVATDAIGVGMNLPIRRVVFMQAYKSFGRGYVALDANTVQQIAGRAGRRGMFSHGYYTEVNTPGLAPFAKHRYAEEVPDITEARMPFPKELLEIQTTLSKTMEMWEEMPSQPGYLKESLKNEIRLAKRLEEWTDNKELIYRLVTLPFSERNRDLERFWETLAASEIFGEPHYIEIPDDKGPLRTPGDLARAENSCSYLDLAYQFCRVFGYDEECAAVSQAKQQLSHRVIEYLDGGEYGEKRCVRCGKRMNWNARGGLCRECIEKERWQRKKLKGGN